MARSFPLKVLVVDDDANIRRTLALNLKDLGCVVEQASSVEEALKTVASQEFDLLLTDYKMEGATGLELIAPAKALRPGVAVVVMTAYASFENAVAVIKEGAFDYLPKPFTTEQVSLILRKVRELAALRHENAALKKSQGRRDYFTGFTSKAMTSLEEFIRKAAPTEATILLTGESGTGKSELAKLIHDLSPRSAMPFITVHCTTLAESLMESELFGHVKGSFTGALQDKIGKLELADGGTLFLDEIGDLSPNGQAKLLRFLQDRVFERIGSNKEINVNARVIAATNKDLVEAVKDGTFREDLYYRLNVLECILAPLRHRLEDLPVLIERLHKGPLPPDVRAKLLEYHWPGNVRELRNVLERLTMLSAGRAPRLSDLPEWKPPVTGDHPAIRTIEAMEKDLIMKVLALESNQERAAEMLGITKVTLWRRRKQYGLI